MGEVININVNQPTLEGSAICSHCHHEWHAVAPIGTYQLECPECRTEKGIWKYPVSPRDEYLFECNCGSQLFYCLPDCFQCRECGQVIDPYD